MPHVKYESDDVCVAGTSCVSGRGDSLCLSGCDSGPAAWRSACAGDRVHGEGTTALHGHLQGQDGHLRGSALLALNRDFKKTLGLNSNINWTNC